MRQLRILLERMMRDQVRRRRMPQEFGGLPIMVSTAGGLRYFFKPISQIDPDLLSAARMLIRKGDTVWDIGANIGLFTVAAAGLVGSKGRVVAFEPDTSLVALLRRTASLQPSEAAELLIIPAGMAGVMGFRSFAIASRARASNALAEYGNSQAGGVRELQTIMCLSLDECLKLLPSPDVVKIDVEGAEAELLDASSRFLRDARPALAIEVSPRNSVEIGGILVGSGYRLFDGAKPLLPNSDIESPAWNTIAIPAEKAGRFIQS
ncbi:MAG: FkbM family methyltransferase [Mesorhizobium sp.]|nr:MAG: FkbM family methyltransferase [Mesorhizobium sp.]RWK50390.1 MAG: FkbM family methyltransferase [Mesorhizobium sp.]RWK98250.1 MAG: FkbM family methyltransferase [Mesorhizobium sp.]TIQ98502.1 MAG: FkbM family methyltransferase [Mesorhizobium sp.]TJW56821.1 MAG: FkbM family methyltransferase [Mesorhizobium sp.]